MASEAAGSERLATAFDAFNGHSQRLVASYDALQNEVSELKAALAASRRTRAAEAQKIERIGRRLAGLMETLPAAVIVIDTKGTICECNSRAIRLLNSPLIGVAWSVVAKREFCRGASQSGGLKLRSGQWLSLSRQALADDQGEILLLADISEARGNAELVGRAERLASIGEMTASLGHQIRTPLASALLYAAQLEESDDEVQRALGDRIACRLRDVGVIVDDMLRYARGTKCTGESVSVTSLLHDVAETIAPQLTSGTRLKIEISDESCAVIANRDSLKGALLNLVSNAVQACGDRPVIELSAVRAGSQICLTVTDNGKGISDSIRHRIFDPFFTTRPQGTGLGLAVVRAVAQAHGGEVMLQPVNSGTAISICIPCAGTDMRSIGEKTT